MQQYDYSSGVASILYSTVTNIVTQLLQTTVLQYGAAALFRGATTGLSGTTITIVLCFYKHDIAIAL